MEREDENIARTTQTKCSQLNQKEEKEMNTYIIDDTPSLSKLKCYLDVLGLPRLEEIVSSVMSYHKSKCYQNKYCANCKRKVPTHSRCKCGHKNRRK